MALIDKALNTALHTAHRAIAQAMCRDQRHLQRLWLRWKNAPEQANARAAFEAALAASRHKRAQREQAPLKVNFDPSLPITQTSVLAEIQQAILTRQVIVIAGETGSGKTTQLPKMCLAVQRGCAGMIGCTQPRRIATRAVASRVAEELAQPLGEVVGYQVRFRERTSDQTRIKFMTDGILLAEIAHDRWLSQYDTLIIDEAHERSLNIDFILGYLKQLLPRRKDLKVIVMSATIDTERFGRFFADALTIHVQGRTFPVELRYRPLETLLEVGKERSEPSVEQGIVAAIQEVSAEYPRGDILVFLPGEREIRRLHQTLARLQLAHTHVLPLYARLSANDQQRVFQPGSQRRIILATNVAETSITIPAIRVVIDPGYARIKRYSPRQKIDRLQVEPISQASANQRSGRCGRVAAGVCYRLYAEEDYLARPAYTDAEIFRSSLAGVILQMLHLKLGPIEDFPMIEQPNARAVADGWQQLAELNAIDENRRLSQIGRQMAHIPVDVKLARMLVAAQAQGCLRPILIIVAFLAIQDPRERPHDAREAADRAHAHYADRQSEFIGILRLWHAFSQAHADLTQGQLRQWTHDRFLNLMRLREWWELHRQLRLVCEQLNWLEEKSDAVLSLLLDASETVPAQSAKATRGALHRQARLAREQRQLGGVAPAATTMITGQDDPLKPKVDARRQAAAYRAVHCAIMAGLATQLGHRSESGEYYAPRQRRFQLFPGSSLARTPPSWVLTATLLETQKVWGVINARIQPEWAVAQLPHLISRSYHHPFWSSQRGQVMVSMQLSLFGLVLIPKQLVPFGPIDAQAAHDLFVRQALVTGEIQTRAGFVAENFRTLERAREQEEKQRRIGLIVDDDWQVQWYLDRIPSLIHSAAGLDAWWSKAASAERQRLYWNAEEVMLGNSHPTDFYPPYLSIGDNRLPICYRFEPGADDDGVTVEIPLRLLHALDLARLSWLTPAFVFEKATALIRSLAKARRKNYVPAPAFAQAFFEAYPTPSADSLEGELARFLTRATGVELSAQEFDHTALAPYLMMNLRLRSEEGAVLMQSRDYQALCHAHGQQATAAFARHVDHPLLHTPLDRFPPQPIPLSIIQAGIHVYPALVSVGERVELQVLPTQEQARSAHADGVVHLIKRVLAKPLKQAGKQLPISAKTGLLFATIETQERLRTDLVDSALTTVLDSTDLAHMRTAEAFSRCCADVSTNVFERAIALLHTVESIAEVYAQVKARLEPQVIGWASANLDDMRQQLDALVYPGFLRQTPADYLAEYPRYLRGIAIRAERALHNPTRDQARILELRPLTDALAAARAQQRDRQPDWQAMRWDLEELRIGLFAQELQQRSGVSLKKMLKRLTDLQASD